MSRIAQREYDAVLKAPTSLLGAVMDVQRSKNLREYPFYGDVGLVEEDRGNVEYDELERYKFSLLSEPYRNSFRVYRKDVADSEIQYVPGKTQDLFNTMLRHRDQLTTLLLEDGETLKAFDDLAYFSNRADQFNNLIAGTGTDLAKLQNDLKLVRVAAMRAKSHRGNPMYIRPNIVMVPPELEDVFLRLQTATYGFVQIAGNPVVGDPKMGNVSARYITQLIVNPYLVDTNDWYMMYGSANTRPFILQTGATIPAIGPGAFSRREIRVEVDMSQAIAGDYYGIVARTRHIAGFGIPQMCFKVKNS
jgi:phage major head subunit gpT-like protein